MPRTVAALYVERGGVLDLFSAAAGGWSLGMHRAGFKTIAACEAVEWRRILYAQNNPGVPIYDNVETLTADRLLRDIGQLPAIIVGSPPCQDISSANTKGKGVEGERSGLFFEAIRLIGECRPRWFALENSANLRTRGADPVLAALEAIGYTCWPLVVRASDIGANHERPRAWLIGCDLAQVTAHAYGYGEHAQPEHDEVAELSGLGNNCNTESFGHEGGRTRRHGPHGDGTAYAGDTTSERRAPRTGDNEGVNTRIDGSIAGHDTPHGDAANADKDEVRQPVISRRPEPKEAIAGQPDRHELARETPDPDQAGQEDGCMVTSLRQEEIANDGRGDGRCADRSSFGQMAVCEDDSSGPDGSGAVWSLDDLTRRVRMDDGLPARVARTRVAVGGPRGTVAASLIVEAYGDAVVPQIPEAIGKAILRVELAMSAIIGEVA